MKTYGEDAMEGEPNEYTVLSLEEIPEAFLHQHPDQEQQRQYFGMPCGTKSLLVRPAYEAMDGIIEKMLVARLYRSIAPGLVITGNPGIGKLFYLSYTLVKFLPQARSIVFQEDTNKFYYFNEKVVIRQPSQKLDTFLEDHHVCALFDTPPPESVKFAAAFIIQASSPKRSHYKEWIKQKHAQAYYMAAWSLWEIHTTARISKSDN